MKVLVVYFSQTSNTKRVAESIYEGASKEQEADIESLEDLTVFADYRVPKPTIRFLESIPENPPFSMAGFYTHATYTRDDKRFKRAEEVFDKWAARGLRTFERISREKGIDARAPSCLLNG